MVIDASVAIAWLLEDENEPDATALLSVLDEQGAIVPQLWHLETRNALLRAERRRRINHDQIVERLGYLSTLPIHTDQQPDYDAAMQFARTHNLTFYDALYLELAIRRDAQLATLDSALSQAADAEGLSNPGRT